MRIPYKINKNTHVTYQPSLESLILVAEALRHLLAEDFEWDKEHCSSLTTLCVNAINANFEKKPIIDELPCQDRDYLLETLDVNLPLELVIPLINDEIYWERRYYAKFGTMLAKKRNDKSWKCLYIERQIQDMIEQAQPEHNDEDEMSDMTKLFAPYVTKVVVTQLQAWKPPLHWDEEDIPEFYPDDHIDFNPIFKCLPDIEEFDVVYGMNNVSDKYNSHMVKVSILDSQRLGKAFTHLKHLRILRIHRSRLEDDHIRAFMQGFIKNETTEELHLSHCLIGDQGALCIAKLLTVHPNLRFLNLCNNRIGRLGCEGLGFALLEPGCVLQKLNLKLNPLHEEGALGIMRALVRGTQLSELSMAACEFEGVAAIRIGQMLMLNTSLKRLDVSNNWFDEEGGKSLIEGLTLNTTLEWLDLRETDISPKQQIQINQFLIRNRLGVEKSDESDVSENVTVEEVEGASQATNITLHEASTIHTELE